MYCTVFPWPVHCQCIAAILPISAYPLWQVRVRHPWAWACHMRGTKTQTQTHTHTYPYLHTQQVSPTHGKHWHSHMLREWTAKAIALRACTCHSEVEGHETVRWVTCIIMGDPSPFRLWEWVTCLINTYACTSVAAPTMSYVMGRQKSCNRHTLFGNTVQRRRTTCF
jgi:hypothetical protein